MDNQAMSVGPTPTQKVWENIVANSVTSASMTTDVLVAGAVDFKTIETNSLTLVEQASVPNPAVGSVTLYVDNVSGMLNSQDSLGNTLPYVPTSGAVMTGPLRAISTVPIIFQDSKNNVNIGGAVATGTHCIILAVGNSFAQQANCISIGTTINTAAQYAVGVGDNITAFNTAFSSVSLGGGNTGIIQRQQYGVAMPADNTLLAGNFGIAIGQGAGVGATNNAIALGQGAVNNTSHTALLGDVNIINVRPNNASLCDLGSSVSPFKTTWLRDAAPASGCKYSMYDDVTVTNTVVETPLLTGTSVGSLVASANASLGTVYRFRIGCTWTGTVADTAIFRFETNGAPLVAITMGPSNTVTQAMTITGEVVVSSGGNAKCDVDYTIDGVIEGMTRATSAYDNTIANTFGATVEWSAADPGDILVVNYAYIETLFAQ